MKYSTSLSAVTIQNIAIYLLRYVMKYSTSLSAVTI